ncbi:MAG: hypothetical protein JXK05_05930 [Campylobacterales bacterium]|nr:hypothetical protein [Campylobacterales bacterium]
MNELLEKIRIGFLFDHPFLSVLALSLPFELRTNRHEAFETDGYHLYFDEAKAARYGRDELKYLYAHILLHVLLKHAHRIGERDASLWNRSCDIVINLLLRSFERVGVMPEDEVMIERFEEMSVEEVYHALYQEQSDAQDKPDENPSESKRDLIEQQGSDQAAQESLDALIVQAMGAARKQGNMSAAFLECITQTTRPKIDLYTLLHAYLSESFFHKSADFSKPNRRFIHQGLYLPGWRRDHDRLELLIALDRSMSISTETFMRFLGVIEGVLGMGGEFEIVVVPFDSAVNPNSVVRYGALSQRPKKLSFEKGDGGTDFGAFCDYIKPHLGVESVLLVLSDGLFKIEHALGVRTLFLISETKQIKRIRPYGDVVHFEL